ncbi:MAG: hypothetical protein KAS78_05250 [Candidatus Pacebacteria bacterium]|nr:hypothetical protein [Candidatus Paceibacterota bacterium]
MKKSIFVAICMIGGIFLAQEAIAFTVSPPRAELFADPGQKIEDAIKIFNETNEAITVYTSTANFIAKEGVEGVPRFLTLEEKEGDLAEWFEIQEGPITLLPAERKIIQYSINIPENADPGGHYAGIFFGTQIDMGEGKTGAGLSGKTGVLILLSVAGDIKEKGVLEKFKLNDERNFYEHLPVNFVVGFENFGNVHLKPQGEIVIKDILGRISASIDVNKRKIGSGANILPSTIRHFESSWIKNDIEKEPRGFLEKLKAEKQNFALGRYKANLNLVYGSGNESVQASIVFWVFPWHLMLVSAIAIIILLMFIIFAIKKYNRWIIKKAIKERKAEKACS